MSEQRGLPAHLDRLGFERNPFPQTPDADCYFRTESIKQKFTETLHCVMAGKGFVLLTGEVGTGKSTFLRCLMDDLIAGDCAVAFVFNTFLQGRDLLLAINRDFGLATGADPAADSAQLNHLNHFLGLAPGADLAGDIHRLNQFLIERHARGRTCVVVIDDAQNLDSASLELLRLLSNLETRHHKLLQIVLSGQPELVTLLVKPQIRQLASRIVQHVQLAPFTRNECARYIDFRIARAGSDGRIRLTDSAQSAVYRHSRGNPRRVHLIMDRCLYGVLSAGRREIGKRLVDTAAGEVGVAMPARRGALRNWAVTGIVGLGIALAAWASTRPAAPPVVPVVQPAAPPVVPVVQPAAPSVLPVAQPAAPPVVPVVQPAAPPVVPDVQPLQQCLDKLGSGSWQTVLQDGLNADTQRGIERALADNGLSLAALPAALEPAQSSSQRAEGPCRWQNGAGAWVLWRAAHPSIELKDGSRGKSVRWLQQRLTDAGHYSGPIDSIVGPHTVEAVASFRRQHDISAAGGIDSWTLFLLEHDLEK